MRRIVPIVEGHSEQGSIPALIRRILQDRGEFAVEPDGNPVREHLQRLARPDVFVRRVRQAQSRDGCAAVLAVMDADDDAACLAGPQLIKAVTDAGVTIPCKVVLAVREIEAWLLAGIESLRGYKGVRSNAACPTNVEDIRGAKERRGDLMEHGYKPTIHQLPLLLRFDYQSARGRAHSLDKYLRDLESLVQAAKARLPE